MDTKVEIIIKSNTVGFSRSEKIRVKASDHYSAYKTIGRRTGNIIRNAIEDEIRGLSKAQEKALFSETSKKLKVIEKLVKKELFLIEGVNWLERYLQAFYGTCDGAEITYAQGAMLQSDSSMGCQSILVQEKNSGEVRLVHSEEDGGLDLGKGFYRYRVVEVTIAGNKYTYFCYPEVFGWGGTFAINESKGMVQVVDDLYIKAKHNLGYFWVQALGFMLLECGDPQIADQIIQKATGLVFNGGYAIHMAFSGENPKIKSVECASNKIKVVPPKDTGKVLIAAQTNCPLHPEIVPLSDASKPAKTKRKKWWSVGEAELYVEMSERTKRLNKLALEADWLGKNANESIKEGQKLLANPQGDIGKYKNSNGKVRYLLTGFPSNWMVAHFTAYLGIDQLSYRIGKLLPKKIKGQEYSMEYKEGYKFAGIKLWEKAKREYRQYTGGLDEELVNAK